MSEEKSVCEYWIGSVSTDGENWENRVFDEKDDAVTFAVMSFFLGFKCRRIYRATICEHDNLEKLCPPESILEWI